MQTIYEDEIQSVPNIAEAPAKDTEQQIKRMELLVGVAFPAAPYNVQVAIACALYVKQALGWASWAFCHPKIDLDQGLEFAVNALIRSYNARNMAYSVFNNNKPEDGFIVGFVTPDGYITGTSNVAEDGANNFLYKQRKEIIDNLEEFEDALIDLNLPNSSAISAEGWLKFCKALDLLVKSAASTCHYGLQLLLEEKK